MLNGSLYKWGNVRGLTVLELVVVLALVGLTALLALPRMSDGLNDLFLHYTANQLVRDIRFIQQQAMNNPSGGWKILCVSTQTTDGHYTETASWSIFRYENGISQVQNMRQLPSGFSFFGINFPNQEIRFTELGAPVTAGHVGIRNNLGHTLYIIVAPVTGKTRIDTQPPR